jgi:hypothetical protein
MLYSKTYVPVTTVVTTANENNAVVLTGGDVAALTGDNTADGSDGGKGGNSGTSGSGAGNGGNGASGDDGGSATATTDYHGYVQDRYHKHQQDDTQSGPAIAGDGGTGGDGATGGSTGNTGKAGNGATGGDGGVIVTGRADTAAGIVNVVNRSVTRIER